nr:TPA: Inhibitor of Apoptosis protein [Oryctes rhinoceros nudivirus]
MSSISRQAPCLNLHRLENILLALDVFDNVRENIENHRDHELEHDPLLGDEERLLINRRRNKRRRDRATLGVERLECILAVLDSYDSLEARYRTVVSNGVDITVRRLEQILIAMGAFDEIIDDGSGANALDTDDDGDDHDNAAATADAVNITTIDDDGGAYTDERPFRYVSQYRREDHIRSTTRPLLLRSHNDEETNTAANATPLPQPSSTLLSDNTVTNNAFSSEMPTDENIYELVTFRINNDGDDGGDENVGDVGTNNDDDGDNDVDAGEHTSTYNLSITDSAIAAATATVLAPITAGFDGEFSIMHEMIAQLDLLAMDEDESPSLSRIGHGNNSSGSNNVAMAPSAPPLDEAEATQTVDMSTQTMMNMPPEEIYEDYYDEEDEAAAEAARRMVDNELDITGLARYLTRGKLSIVYPAFALLHERLKSFANWPIALIQKPKVMADAGFYYTNHGDQVVCFSCGLGMHRWLPEDDPWEKHAEYNIRDKCSYLYMMRDAAFIAKCKRRRQRVEATPPPMPTSQAADDDDDEDDKAEVKVVPPKCNYCLEYDCSIVFVPCGHFTSCSQCSFAFTACPICRRDISDKIKIFW